MKAEDKIKIHIKNALTMLNLERSDIGQLPNGANAPHSMKNIRYIANELKQALEAINEK